VQIHCNGDYTLDIALDAIEAAYSGSTDYGVNRIEHATMARPDQILRMKKLNVQPSFLMNHVRFYGGAYRDQIFGPERAAFMDPAGACVKAGLPFTLHTDAPCSPQGPLALISTAVTRRCIIDNSVVGPDQAITLDDAIRAVTIYAAHQLGQGDRLGSLENGKEADFTILESDPYKVSPDAIADIKVSETWVAGERKFGA
jgi:predicted amidohydrolase YtcJ